MVTDPPSHNIYVANCIEVGNHAVGVRLFIAVGIKEAILQYCVFAVVYSLQICHCLSV